MTARENGAVAERPAAIRSHGEASITMAGAIRAMDLLPDRDFTFVDSKGADLRLSFPELGLLSRRLGAGLLESGLGPGGRIAIVSREPFDSVRCLFAAFAAGIVPVLVYPPNLLGDNAAYFDHLDAQLKSAGADRILMDGFSMGLLAAPLAASSWKDRILRLDALTESDPERLPAPESQRPDDIALLQFTSGSGSLSKAVAVTHGNLRANSRAILVDGLAIGPGDRAVCWLPLYHDMGLIGHVIAPLREGLNVTLYPTSAFLKRPSMWMDALSKRKGTITFAPNFAYGLASRAKPAAGLDLGAVRVLGCGAEPIHAETLRRFLDAHRACGLDPAAMFPCYGLAEHTLAAAFPRVGEGLIAERIGAATYRDRAVAVPAEPGEEALEFVSCGRAFPGHGIAIVPAGPAADRAGSKGNASDTVPPGDAETGLPEGAVGEIALRGPSVAAGYLDREEETRAAFSGGALRTGDLGFIRDGRLFVTGRHKDLVILNGRNFDPHHIEHVAEQVPEVRAGSAFAFSIPGPVTERLVILYETRALPTEPVDKAIKAALAAALGVTPFAVAAQKAHSLPKTTSGKKRRRAARERFLLGTGPAEAAAGTGDLPGAAAGTGTAAIRA
jgi:fatty-acyl-CoA synthase